MRELKFRAWINKLKKWADYVIIHSAGGFYAYLGESPYAYSDVEQYTGLVDKNGKEIYEGDIVKYSWFIHYYDNGDSEEGIDISDVIFRDAGYEVGFGERAFHLSSHCLDWVEIIGNIHENPELIGAENVR